MFVADDVFGRMQRDAEESIFGGVSIGVVSLLQLIALKCHAVRHTRGLRVLKDSDDLIHLIQINGLNLKEPELQATILKHGNQALYDKLQLACVPRTDGALHDAPTLEFPDWSGMQPRRVSMSFAEACCWNEEMLALFPPKPDSAARRSKARCEVPFEG